jgi:hypothetical protein
MANRRSPADPGKQLDLLALYVQDVQMKSMLLQQIQDLQDLSVQDLQATPPPAEWIENILGVNPMNEEVRRLKKHDGCVDAVAEGSNPADRKHPQSP